MKTLIMFCIFFGWANYFAQESNPNQELHNTWIIKQYYDRLIQTDSLYSAFKDSDYFIRMIYISKNLDALTVSSLNEGNSEKFTVINKNQLLVTENPFVNTPYTLSLISREGKTLLALHEVKQNNNDTMFYVPLDKKYSSLDGYERFINDRFITGTYASDDNKYKITFHSNGKTEGFGDCNEYGVDVFFSSFAHHDIIHLCNAQKVEDNGTLHRKVINSVSYSWKIVGSEIWLYNLTDEGYGNVTTLFTKLRKTK